MGPVLFLPIAGMLQAISSVMSNTALVTEGGVVWTLGKFINGGVGAVIGNLGVLFCVGIAMSLAKKRKADAAFLALVSYLVWLAANSRWLDVAGLTIAGDTASALYGTGQTICLGYHVTDMGVFLGMILGVVVALVHNRFIDTEFEGAMAMYGNSKFVFVVLLPIVLVMAVVASYVWPVAAAGITRPNIQLQYIPKKCGKQCYSMITNCNSVINESTNLNDGDPETIKLLVAESKTLRALYYSILVCHYGPSL